MHEGHRLRMYEKLKNHPAALEEHELLEILLYNAVPRRNTNQLAHRLLDEFGSVRTLFEADIAALQEVEDVGPQLAGYIKCIAFFFQRYNAEKEGSMPVKYETESFEEDINIENFLEHLGENYKTTYKELQEKVKKKKKEKLTENIATINRIVEKSKNKVSNNIKTKTVAGKTNKEREV